MRSHFYVFSLRQCSKVLAAPVAGVAILAGGLHSAHWLGLLSAATPIENPTETLLAFKAKLSCSQHPAQVILLGDSSCATGIDAPTLGALLPGRPGVLNLALFLGFGLDMDAEILTDYVRHNPDQVRLVVLMVTPRFLAHPSANPLAYRLWRQAHLRDQHLEPARPGGFREWLGVGLLKDHFVGKVFDAPVGGGFYGFSSDFIRYLRQHEGSVIEPGLYHPPLHPNFEQHYLAPALEKDSREFHKRLPPGVKLAIAMIPVAESLSPPEYRRTRDELLLGWNRWIQADYVLTNAPARLPDAFFASECHPNPTGQELFTRRLAAELNRVGASSALRPEETNRSQRPP